MATRAIRLAISPGEPAGIGPEIVAKLAALGVPEVQLVAIADRSLLEDGARVARTDLRLERFDKEDYSPTNPGSLRYIPLALPQENEFGFLRQGNARYVIAVLQRAAAGCLSGEFDGMVTGPVHKGVINDAGIAFVGHTEFLQRMVGSASVVMMLVSGQLRVALVTTHIPLRRVPYEITQERLRDLLTTLDHSLRTDYGFVAPRIAVLALNPHAGEGGHMGTEEIEVIAPVIDNLRKSGMLLHGPLSADTAFTPDKLKQFDLYVAMYHDQGLPVLKALGFGAAVNVTLGLPFVRTSVDHGTALEIAGKGLANEGSMIMAVHEAAKLIAARKSL